jgi:predicted aspartyl protease
MNCQALIRIILSIATAGALTACQTEPLLDHRAVSPRLLAGLAANSRALTTQEHSDSQQIHLEVTITKNGSVSLPMSMRDGVPLVPVRLNQREARPFLVDTGSQGCVLEARTAVADRVTMLDQNVATTTLGGTTGREQALIGTPAEIAIGSWVMEQFPFFVRTYETRVKMGWWERHNIGLDLIGMNAILKSCDYLTIDFPGENVVFGIGRRFPSPSGPGVWKAPLIMRNGLPYVELNTDGRKWTALVDTGFNGLLDMDKDTAKRLKLLEKAQPAEVYRFGLGAPVKDEPVHFGTVVLPKLDSLGPRMANLPTLIVPRQSKLGCALLEPFRVTLDFRRGLLWLEDARNRRAQVAAVANH